MLTVSAVIFSVQWILGSSSYLNGNKQYFCSVLLFNVCVVNGRLCVVLCVTGMSGVVMNWWWLGEGGGGSKVRGVTNAVFTVARK
jgi:hypothetical protein